MKITVYGPGCKNCTNLTNNAKAAIEELGIEVEIEKVEDINEIAMAGVLRTPGLAIDGELKVEGKVATKEEIKDLIE
ncbi:thioredoxin family protein [Fuchsiella alkaliacetigena]|uniref:thioredoxin family protein n=1 Tax=Fuchsiella alkaliacetigena TaxID=957042 RepID=UPI00200AC05D|nr:thioredoxin family protein [Fuchsiella alkaliacetigena]MCK8825996.1 thioredoxin family protein [Fuchsiella alkaliacetigena]